MSEDGALTAGATSCFESNFPTGDMARLPLDGRVIEEGTKRGDISRILGRGGRSFKSGRAVSSCLSR